MKVAFMVATSIVAVDYIKARNAEVVSWSPRVPVDIVIKAVVLRILEEIVNFAPVVIQRPVHYLLQLERLFEFDRVRMADIIGVQRNIGSAVWLPVLSNSMGQA